MTEPVNQENTLNVEWISTYGILTAERILERFKVKLSRDELVKTLKDPTSRYHHMVSIPLKNILNGILISQVHDYQVYAQKLLIDYKLTQFQPAASGDSAQQGTESESSLKMKQEELILLGEHFMSTKSRHRELIAESQAWLIQIAPKQSDVTQMPEMLEFSNRCDEMTLAFETLRQQFRSLIVDMTALLALAPNYHMDTDKLSKNHEGLEFTNLIADQ